MTDQPPRIVRRRLRLVQWLGAALSSLLALPGAAATAQSAAESRQTQTQSNSAKSVESMIRAIERDLLQTRRQIRRNDFAPATWNAMRSVPRDEFVPADQRPYAYENRPLRIGHGQTISQPYIVALMTDLLEIDSESRVLEVGTGSGYQAAVAGEIATKVYSIEIVEPLARRARETLDRLGYDNVETRVGDGYHGWPEAAPFEAIIVTAGAEEVPPRLVEQLATGGRLVIPVGPQRRGQELLVLRKRADGSVETDRILPVLFVPFVRGVPDPPP